MMSAQLEIKYPRSDRWAYLWLALGVVLLTLSTGQFRLAFAAWLAPVFLIRFFRSQRAGKGYWRLLLVQYVAFAITWYAILEFAMPLWVFLIFNIMVTLLNSLPYLADRLLAPHLRGFTATLVYPLTATAVFLLYNLVSPMGSFGTPGYEQFYNLALIQLVSVTGIWGLIFLVSWCGPVINWTWERSFDGLQLWRGWAVFGGVVAAVLIFGGLRLAFARPTTSTVRIHSFSIEKAQEIEIPDMATDLFGFRRASQEVNEALIAGTLREARRGAQIVMWSEMAGGGIEEDTKALIARAQEVAKQEEIYLAMGLRIYFPNQERPWENKLVVISPDGEIVIDHDKFGATFLYSMMGEGEAFQGTYTMQTVQTLYGNLSGGVCWDADFPMTVKLAGKHKSDILLVPIGDPAGPTALLHAQQHIFRAIENGVSLVRHDFHNGLSVAADPYGRTLAMLDLGNASERVMVVQIPTRGVFTLYPIIGDLFGWLSVVGFVFITGYAISRGRKSTIEETLCETG